MTGPGLLQPADTALAALRRASDLPPFGALQLDFAGALSRALLAAPALRAHPDLVALGYWLRPAHLRRLIDPVQSAAAHTVLLPRGLCFHVAPANVDTLFVYSWVLSLLCGNRNIVRLSSRPGAAADVLLTLLDTLLAQPAWQAVAQRVAFVRYGHDDRLTAALSAACDLRVVWGGDATVQALRAVPLPPHATELCFPDKFSMVLLRASSVNALDGAALAALAQALCNDAYTFGQAACSSPRLVLWLGAADEVPAARAALWPLVEQAAARFAHGLGAADALNKRVAADLLALQADVHIEPGPSLVQRVWLDEPAVHAGLHCGGGLFHEARIGQLAELLPLLDRRVQTLSQHGVGRDEWLALARQGLPRGIDRIVPVGQALDFSPVWDGVDLWRAFTREIDIR